MHRLSYARFVIDVATVDMKLMIYIFLMHRRLLQTLAISLRPLKLMMIWNRQFEVKDVTLHNTIVSYFPGVIVAAPEYEQIIPSLDLDPVYSEVKTASIIYGNTHSKQALDKWDPKLYEVVSITRFADVDTTMYMHSGYHISGPSNRASSLPRARIETLQFPTGYVNMSSSRVPGQTLRSTKPAWTVDPSSHTAATRGYDEIELSEMNRRYTLEHDGNDDEA